MSSNQIIFQNLASALAAKATTLPDGPALVLALENLRLLSSTLELIGRQAGGAIAPSSSSEAPATTGNSSGPAKLRKSRKEKRARRKLRKQQAASVTGQPVAPVASAVPSPASQVAGPTGSTAQFTSPPPAASGQVPIIVNVVTGGSLRTGKTIEKGGWTTVNRSKVVRNAGTKPKKALAPKNGGTGSRLTKAEITGQVCAWYSGPGQPPLSKFYREAKHSHIVFRRETLEEDVKSILDVLASDSARALATKREKASRKAAAKAAKGQQAATAPSQSKGSLGQQKMGQFQTGSKPPTSTKRR